MLGVVPVLIRLSGNVFPVIPESAVISGVGAGGAIAAGDENVQISLRLSAG